MDVGTVHQHSNGDFPSDVGCQSYILAGAQATLLIAL